MCTYYVLGINLSDVCHLIFATGSYGITIIIIR